MDVRQQWKADVGRAQVGGEEHERLLSHGELRQRPRVHSDFGGHSAELRIECGHLRLIGEFHRDAPSRIGMATREPGAGRWKILRRSASSIDVGTNRTRLASFWASLPTR